MTPTITLLDDRVLHVTQAADRLLTNARVYRLAGGDPGDPRTWPGVLAPDAGPDAPGATVDPPAPDAEAVAIRDGRIVAVGTDRDVGHLAGVETDVVDLDGAALFPGFVDAHTHLVQVGLALVHVDLSEATSLEDALSMLERRAERTEEGWVIGVRYDESTWPGGRHPTRGDLDAVAEDRPVAAVRVDLHTAALNGTALDRVPDAALEYVEREDGAPTGVVTESAAGVVEPVFDPDEVQTRRALEAAIDRATALGIVGVHDKVRRSHAPRIYRDLERAGDLDVRVRIDYWSDHLDALREVGLATNDGSDLVAVGGCKTFSDGSIGGRTARLTEPYVDANPEDDARGEWVVPPEDLRAVVAAADEAGLQAVVHAIGDAAIDATLDAVEAGGTDGDGDSDTPARHRIEHLELATDGHLRRMAEAGIIASMQPNFHRWAREGGLYETALGRDRTRRTNRLRAVAEAGVPLAFGSDGMPMDPLYGVHQAVSAPTPGQSLSVGAALKAYTAGAAYAGFDEHHAGTFTAGNRADLVALSESPWEQPDAIDEIDVVVTVVDGRVVFEA